MPNLDALLHRIRRGELRHLKARRIGQGDLFTPQKVTGGSAESGGQVVPQAIRCRPTIYPLPAPPVMLLDLDEIRAKIAKAFFGWPPDNPSIDWYCHKCSKVVLINSRCPVCGKEEWEKA